jgi:hypothetical protein
LIAEAALSSSSMSWPVFLARWGHNRISSSRRSLPAFKEVVA